YSCMSLLISSEPAVSSSEAPGSPELAASGLARSADSAEADGAVSALATGAGVASSVASLTCTFVSIVPGSTVFGTSPEFSVEASDCGAGAAAAAVGLSWSGNMVDGLRAFALICRKVFLAKVFLANSPLGLQQGGQPLRGCACQNPPSGCLGHRCCVYRK